MNKLPLLVWWYGFVQLMHIIVNISLSAILLSLPFAPVAGWSEQAVIFLMGMGLFDTLNAVLSIIFVYGFFRKKSWWQAIGLITLTVSVYAHLLFMYLTAATGAWTANPLIYTSITLGMLPVFILYGMVAKKAAKSIQ